MQPRHVALLAVVAALLGAFIYVVEIRGGAERAAEEAKSRRLWPELDVDSISRLEITTRDGAPAELVRAGEDWRLVAPIDFPASESEVESILSALSSLSREGSVPAGDLAAFGLDEGAPSITFESGGERGALAMGWDTPIGGNRYVRMADAEDVDFVRAHALTALEVSLDDLRDGRVLPFETAAVERARFAWPGGAVELVRRDDGWRLTAPVEVKADTERVDTLLSDLAYLRAEGFVDEASSPDAAAFESPLFEVALEGDSMLAIALSAARPGDSGDDGIVVRGRDGHLFEVASERLDDWPRRVAEYRDKTLSRFDVDAARSFEIVFRDGPVGDGEPDEEGGAAPSALPVRIQAELAAGGWVTGPEAMSPARAAAMVGALSHLEGSDVVAEALGPDERAALGIEPARVRLRVWGEGASGASAPLLADVVLGRTRAGIGTYAARHGESVIHLLDDAEAADIPTSHAAFLDGFVDVSDAAVGEAPGDGAGSVEAAMPAGGGGEVVEPEL